MFDFCKEPDFSRYYSYEELKEWYPEMGESPANPLLAGTHAPWATLLPRGELKKITGKLIYYRTMVGGLHATASIYSGPSRPQWYIDKLNSLGSFGGFLRVITFTKKTSVHYPSGMVLLPDSEGLYVYAKLDSYPELDLRGWITYSPFKEGDEVEIIYAENMDGKYEVYAIARPDIRIVVLTPRCIEGKNRFYYEFIPLWGIFSGVFTLATLLGSFFQSPSSELMYHLNIALGFFLISSMLFCAYVLGFLSKFVKEAQGQPVLFESILGLLGIKNPSWMNIRKYSNKKIKKMVRAKIYVDEIKGYKDRMPNSYYSESARNPFFY